MTLVKSEVHEICTIEHITEKLGVSPQQIAEAMPPDSQDELLREARDAAEKDGDPHPESVSDVPENLVLGMAEFRGVHPTLYETLEYIEGEYTYHMVATELTAAQRYYAVDLQAESTDSE